MILLLFVLLLILIFIKKCTNKEFYKNINKQKKFNKCLSDMKKILDNANQPFFLCCGTLLGQHRENKFIDYDPDIDIGILKSDFNINLKNIISKSCIFKLKKEYGKIKNSYELNFIHQNGIGIDIFIYYPIKKKNWYYIPTHNGICNDTKDKFCKWGRPIRGLKTINFKGNNYLIPSNTDEFLTETYGDWKIPKKTSYMKSIKDGSIKNKLN